MQDLKNSVASIMAFNFFDLIGLGKLDQNAKDELTMQITNLILRRFLESKLTDQLTEEEAQTLANKYKDIQPSQVNDFITEISGKIPNSGELFLEATLEAKAELVRNHYETKKREYLKLLTGETDSEKIRTLKDQVDVCDKNLEYVSQGRWELLAAQELL